MSVLERAAYLELTTLLGNHLLAAQADRVGMAHGIEGRFPFLDHRVFAHSVATRPRDKLGRAAREDRDPRAWPREVVPPIVAQRPKQPYRAPEAAAFFADEPEWVTERLSPEAVRAVGIFDERAVAGLVRRCRAGRATGFRENMALMGVLSTQIWHEAFCAGAMASPRRPRSRACTSASNYPYGWVAPPSPIGGWHFAPHHRPWWRRAERVPGAPDNEET